MSYISGLVQKQQTFLSSGTFTPSAAHLAAGGWVKLFMVGGGGGGSNGYRCAGGGGGSVVSKVLVQVSGACTVTIGAGGAGGTQLTNSNSNGSAGGQSRLYLATALTTLGVAITSTTATTFTATSGAAITNGSIILIDSEEMLVTGIATNTVTVTRGYRNTVAATHLISTSIYASYLTALGGGPGVQVGGGVGGASGGTISSAPGMSGSYCGGGGAGGPAIITKVLDTSGFPTTLVYYSALGAGGPALYGYGAGGCGNGSTGAAFSNFDSLAQNGVAVPNMTAASQSASTPNTGAGGTGGYFGSASVSYAGGTGGSGICIITYSE